jgi:branched-chain amino acid transport system substrate-binding protein
MRKGAKFDTVLGPLGFDKKGDITRPDFIVYAWRRNASGAIVYENNEVTQLPVN